MKTKYVFKGSAVDPFGNVVANSWQATTYAISPAKALANCAWQLAREMGYATARFRLTGSLLDYEEEETYKVADSRIKSSPSH